MEGDLAGSGSKSTAKARRAAAAAQFMALVRRFSYDQGTQARKRLTNFTFFAGAGFSRSWDPRAPVGNDLFTLDTKVIERVADVGALSRMFGLRSMDEITPEQLRQIVYQLDMYEKYPDVRSRYMDEQNIRMFRGALRAAVVDRYNSLTSINYFDATLGKFPLHDPTEEQGTIVRFFRHLFNRADGSQGSAEGVRTQFVTTNYDYVIETILDAALADPNDSHLLYTYRGITPSRIVDVLPNTRVHEHWLVQHLLKINGGFEILRRGTDYVLDYGERSLDAIIQDPPVLMLASREQDYSTPYFKTIFPKVVRLMRDTTVLVVVGYSLPADDALIRFLVRQFAEEPEDGLGKVIFYIDINNDASKRDVIHEVFPGMEALSAPQLITYRGSFSAFAKDCMALADPNFDLE